MQPRFTMITGVTNQEALEISIENCSAMTDELRAVLVNMGAIHVVAEQDNQLKLMSANGPSDEVDTALSHCLKQWEAEAEHLSSEYMLKFAESSIIFADEIRFRLEANPYEKPSFTNKHLLIEDIVGRGGFPAEEASNRFVETFGRVVQDLPTGRIVELARDVLRVSTDLQRVLSLPVEFLKRA
jgi:hypothetical protein